MRNKIIEILINRDGCTEKEAYSIFNQCQKRCLESLESGHSEEIEDIMAEDLGLELDYVFDILF